MSYEIQRLLPRHFKILELTAAGYSRREIAAIAECTEANVTNVQKSPIAQAEIARMRSEGKFTEQLTEDRDAFLGKARSILEQAAEKAASKLDKLIDSDDESVAIRASDSILDRALGKKVSDKAGGMSVNITVEDAQNIVLTLQECSNANRIFRPNENANPSSTDPSLNEQGNVHQTSDVAA